MTDVASLDRPVVAVNIGLSGFADPIRAHGGSAVVVDWRPPAGGDRTLGLLLARLEDDPLDPVGARIMHGNGEAITRLLAAQPRLVDVRPAADVVPFLRGRALLHSGPPIEWSRMCGPVRGAVVGATLLEGWARDPADALELASSGAIAFAACHEHGAVGPMAGVVAPSMPVVVVEDAASGRRAFATLNEGLGKVLRFGAYEPPVLERLRWFASALGPALSAALREHGPVDLRAISAQALQMGDEGHNRNVAATSLFTRTIAPALVRTTDAATAAAVGLQQGHGAGAARGADGRLPHQVAVGGIDLVVDFQRELVALHAEHGQHAFRLDETHRLGQAVAAAAHGIEPYAKLFGLLQRIPHGGPGDAEMAREVFAGMELSVGQQSQYGECQYVHEMLWRDYTCLYRDRPGGDASV